MISPGASKAMRREKEIEESDFLRKKSNTILLLQHGMEVIPDRVHLLIDVDPQFGICQLVKLIKGRSSSVRFVPGRRTERFRCT